MDDKLHFMVDARLITQLGEQLVPSDMMALAEVVKNAYDADATVVLIDYYPNSASPYLIIEDDGDGMTADELRQGWMTIGTSLKERNSRSPRFLRAMAGRKGVGRFAVQRLGGKLKLRSTTEGINYALELDFDWDLFNTGIALESILHAMSTPRMDQNKHGTKLVIQQLHRAWSREDFEKLLRDLITIQAPHETRREMACQDNSDPGFEVIGQSSSTIGSWIRQPLPKMLLLLDVN